jgi:glucose 1-dehydrogenase
MPTPAVSTTCSGSSTTLIPCGASSTPAVRVGVGPGAVATPINLSTMNDPALMGEAERRDPAWTDGEARGDRNVVVFLAGVGGSYVNATTIFADGGMMQSSVGL